MVMPLFTSSSKKTLIAFLSLFLLFGGYKLYYIAFHADQNKTPDKFFWYKKTFAPNDQDILLVGDSRVYRGLSPAAMAAVLKGSKILNFGYSSAGFEPFFLDAAVKKLSAKGKRILVLGVTPHSLTAIAAQNKHYREQAHQENLPFWIKNIEYFFGRDSTIAAVKYLLRVQHGSDQYHTISHDDGWCECYYPLAPAQGLPVYKKLFSSYQVSAEVTKIMLDKVKELTKAGITIFAFRPPTYPAMEQLEDSISGFVEKDFIQGFEAAGGRWLVLDDRFSFDCYDGSHITGTAAKKLSRELGQKIASSLATMQ